MSAPSTLLKEEWQQVLEHYCTVYVGFSGGLDSTVLLHSLATLPRLSGKLQAIHIHHGLSANATAWQQHCQAYCESLGVPLLVREVRLKKLGNIEEQARLLRYQTFSEILSEGDGLLLAHHSDDQAETFLLQLLRGSGINGLASMAALKNFAKGEIARPFLDYSRQTLEVYAKEHRLKWIDDESNQDITFSRNYLRHQVMPLLKKKWPNAVKNIARSAHHCQNAKSNLDVLARADCVELNQSNNTLSIIPLMELQRERLINVLRVWLAENKVRLPSSILLNHLIDELIYARSDATPIVQWGSYRVRRYQHTLFLLKPSYQPKTVIWQWPAFPAPLKIENIDDSIRYVYASSSKKGVHVPINALVQVRFRQGGELFYWHGQTKQLKKLFQQWQVPPWERDEVPLLYINNELAVVVGYAISDSYKNSDQHQAYTIK